MQTRDGRESRESREGLGDEPRSTMKINSFSTTYSSSAANKRSSANVAASDKNATPENRRSQALPNQNSSAAARPRKPAIEHRSQQENATKARAISADVDYFSTQKATQAGFHVPASEADPTFNGDKFQRFNNQLATRAVTMYRSHQEMDDDQAVLQAQRNALGIDTYA